MTQTILDIDAMLDSSLDAVPDVPDYLNPPTGLYVLSVTEAKLETHENKDKEKVARFRVTMKVESTEETEDAPVPDGTLFTQTYMGTEDGLKYFKKDAMKILNVSDLNGVSIRDVLESLSSVEPFRAKIVLRKTKTADGKEYENVNVRPLHQAS